MSLIVMYLHVTEHLMYRVSIKFLPDYKHLLQENYRATKGAHVEVY